MGKVVRWLVALALIGTVAGLLTTLTYGVLDDISSLRKRLDGAPSPIPPPPPIDVKKVPRLWGYDNIGHGCPIEDEGKTFLLTAAHMLAEREHGEWVYWPSTWADGYGNGGEVEPLLRAHSQDLIVAESKTPFLYTFHFSPRPPQKGETLYIVGYNWEGEMGQKLYEVTLLEAFGGNLTYKGSGHGGSSGSCVFLADGSVVGINIAEFPSQNVGVGVAVGHWVRKGNDEKASK